MKKLLCIIFFIVLFLMIAMDCLADDGSANLKNGLRLYQQEADFDGAISELQKAIRLGLDDRTDLIQAHLYMGFAYIGKGQKMAAQAEFANAIRLNPALSLDPGIHSTKIVNVFNETKADLIDSLTVVSVPGGAEVYLDGKSVGVTPLNLNALLVGEYNLKIVKEYFQTAELKARVEKGKNNRIQVQLVRKAVEIIINSVPPEASVYVDDGEGLEAGPRGKTPLSLSMALDQKLTIKLAKEEFLDKEMELRLTAAGLSVSGVERIIPVESGSGKLQVVLDQAPQPGILRISSDPSGAEVQLDGVTVGVTPLNIAKVTPGIRRIRISLANFNSVTQEVKIVSGGAATAEVRLGGRLRISSVPDGAQVFINEKLMGIAPLRTERIPAGSYQLRLATESHKDKLRSIVLERGQEKDVSIRLLPLKGSIAVSSDPAGAIVYLDGEPRGRTPLFVYGIMAGQHSLKLERASFEDWEKNITVEELKVSWHFGKLKQKDQLH